jgi:streptogramin lyase
MWKRKGLFLGLIGLLLVAGCEGTQAPATLDITAFSVPTLHSEPYAIAAGPDGNLWFLEMVTNQIGRITPQGQVSEFPLPTYGGPTVDFLDAITAGPDGNLWFTDSIGIGRITPAGQITQFPLPPPNNDPNGITSGPDGNLWFLLGGKIGRMTPAGQVTLFPLPTRQSDLVWITAGPDGNLWFTVNGDEQIGRITPQGQITEFPLPPSNGDPWGITAGPDGNLWFTELTGNRIGRITPAGQMTMFPLPANGIMSWGITAGPDGNLWFARGNQIGRVTPAGQVTLFPLTSDTIALELTSGPNSTLWFTEDKSNKIGRFTLPGSKVSGMNSKKFLDGSSAMIRRQSLFRAQALRQYTQGREKTVLPRIVAPPVFFCCWLLLGLLLLTTSLAWQVQVPIYSAAFGELVQQPSSQRSTKGWEAILFVPAISAPEVQAGDAITLQIVLSGQQLSGMIAHVSPGVITPDEARRQYDLQGDLALVITHPSVVLQVALSASLPPGMIADSSVSAQVQVGSQSVLSLLPTLLHGFLGG